MSVVAMIEDDTDLGTVVRDSLEMDGFRVVWFPESEHLEQDILSLRPDVVVIDMMLSGKCGIEVAQDLRDAGLDRTPLIGITGSLFLAETARDTMLFREVLEKPFDLDALAVAVSEVTAAV